MFLQKKISTELQVMPIIQLEKEFEFRIQFIQEMLLNSNSRSLVLGISGGVDSALAGALCQIATEMLSVQENESYDFYAMRLPYGEQFDESDAQEVLKTIKPNYSITHNIQSSVDAFMSELPAKQSEASHSIDFLKGNFKARIRMATQYYYAGLYNGLVVGTDHAAEAVSGFFTKFGDGACDLAPLYGLTKRQVRSLASYVGISDRICGKIPTADLEDKKPGYPDEEALQMTYDQIDDYLELKLVDKKVQVAIEKRYQMTDHKRKPISIPSSRLFNEKN